MDVTFSETESYFDPPPSLLTGESNVEQVFLDLDDIRETEDQERLIRLMFRERLMRLKFKGRLMFSRWKG